MAAHEMTIEQAQERLQERRPHVLRGLSQRTVVQQFDKLLRDGEWDTWGTETEQH
jgi:hypothetical protein